jgi:hypothetical protein
VLAEAISARRDGGRKTGDGVLGAGGRGETGEVGIGEMSTLSRTRIARMGGSGCDNGFLPRISRIGIEDWRDGRMGGALVHW